MNKVVEKFGIYFSDLGLSKTYGRLFGLFMLSNQPLSMNCLIEKLQVSKSTASTELRRLLSMGILEKISLPYQRADYYQLKANLWVENLNQKKKNIEQLKQIIQGISDEELEIYPHLQEMQEYCDFLEVELEVITLKYLNKLKEKLNV